MNTGKPFDTTPFCGAHTALITPFSGDAVDYADLKRLVDFQIDGGIDGLVAAAADSLALYSELGADWARPHVANEVST
jgi:hypothetical protein